MARKHHYPNHRRTPIRHRVKAHKRLGAPVRSFIRGKGTHPVTGTPITMKKLAKSLAKAYTVNFKYSTKAGDVESVVVFAPAGSYQRALDEALEEKRDPRTAIEVEIVDPSIGSVLKVIGSRLKTAGKFVAEQAAKGLHSASERGKVTILVHQSYSPHRTIRILARAKLKKEYPEIYNLCDFSEEKSIVPTQVPTKPPTGGITIDFKPVITSNVTEKVSKARTPSEIRKIVRTEIKRQAKEQGVELSKQEEKKRVQEWVSEKWIKKAQKVETDRADAEMYAKETEKSRKKSGE